MRLHAPAAQRNAAAILEVLRTVLPAQGRVLEVASGTGQHVAAFAQALPRLHFIPTEHDAEKLPSIRAWTQGLPNVADPIRLDVTDPAWPLETVESAFCANMIHIAPAEATEGLLAGVGRHLGPGGTLVLYGPFKIEGRHTAPSNEAFDASLRARDPRWGVRDLESVRERAAVHGLAFAERIAMPANNQILVFRREVS